MIYIVRLAPFCVFLLSGPLLFVLKFHTDTGDFVTKQRPNSLCYKYILAMKLVALHVIGVFPVLYCENSFILLSFAFLIVKDMQMQRAEKLYYSCTFLQVPVPIHCKPWSWQHCSPTFQQCQVYWLWKQLQY